MQLDGAVGELLLGDGVAPLTRLDATLLHRVRLQEQVEFDAIAPDAFEVIEVNGAGQGFDDDGVLPAREADDPARGLAAVELSRALDGIWKTKPLTGPGDGGGIVNLGRDGDDVRDGIISFFRGREGRLPRSGQKGWDAVNSAASKFNVRSASTGMARSHLANWPTIRPAAIDAV